MQVVYEYRYSVDDQRSGVVNDRWEQRIGQFVKGSYSLLEPSGKVRSVSYEVDGPRGFVAVVRTTFPGIWVLKIAQSDGLQLTPISLLFFGPSDILYLQYLFSWH